MGFYTCFPASTVEILDCKKLNTTNKKARRWSNQRRAFLFIPLGLKEDKNDH
jgi:hypothetical protein